MSARGREAENKVRAPPLDCTEEERRLPKRTTGQGVW